MRHRLHVCSDNIIAKCHDRRLNVKSRSFFFFLPNKENHPFLHNRFLCAHEKLFVLQEVQTVFCHPVPKSPLPPPKKVINTNIMKIKLRTINIATFACTVDLYRSKKRLFFTYSDRYSGHMSYNSSVGNAVSPSS